MNTSPLGRLPAELRNEIYRLILQPSDGIDIFLHGPTAELGPLPTPNEDFALAQTCEQIGTESNYILYTEATFRFRTSALSCVNMQHAIQEKSQTCFVENYQSAWNKSFISWNNYVKQKTGLSPRKVVIHLGTWDYSTSVVTSTDEEAIANSVMLAAENIGGASDVAIGVDLPEMQHELSYLCLPLATGDIMRTKEIFQDACRQESRRLQAAWKGNSVTMAQYASMQTSLQMMRRWLGQFVGRLAPRAQSSVNATLDSKITLIDPSKMSETGRELMEERRKKLFEKRSNAHQHSHLPGGSCATAIVPD